MNHLLNDHARSVNDARFEPEKVAPLRHRPNRESSPLKSTIGNALIRAGTRMVPAAAPARHAQTNLPC